MRLIRCKRCGSDFETNKNGAYMCPNCADKIRKEAVYKDRICIDCGTIFKGYPKSKRCPECAKKACRERERRQKRDGPKRPLGSIDKCQKCGEEYIVESGLQRYCKKCSSDAVRENVREIKREYMIEHKEEFGPRKAEMRANRKVCVICGKTFDSGTPSITCSPDCEKEYNRRKWIKIDYNRGRRKSDDITPYDSGLPKSGVVGVSYRKKTGKWQASVKGKYIGVFETVEDASAAIEKYKSEEIKNK